MRPKQTTHHSLLCGESKTLLLGLGDQNIDTYTAPLSAVDDWDTVRAACTVTASFDTISADPFWAFTGSYTRYYVLVVDASGIVTWSGEGQAWTPLLEGGSTLNEIEILRQPDGDYTVSFSTIPVAAGTVLAETNTALATVAHWGMQYLVHGCADGLVDTERTLHTDVSGWYGTGYRSTWASDDVYSFPLPEDTGV